MSFRRKRLSPVRGLLRVRARFTAIMASSNVRLAGGNAENLSRNPRCKFFKNQRNHGHICDFIFRERLSDKFRTQRPQMDNGPSAGKRHKKAAHEIDRVIRGDNAQVARAGSKRKNRRHGGALLQVIVVSQHAPSGVASRA